MFPEPRSRRMSALVAALSLSIPGAAWALDKQGSAHGGEADGGGDGFDVSGALTLGSSIINHSYAARPDNSGLTLMRYAGHADVDLMGPRLSIPLDVNMFTDRLRGGAAKLSPTEFDAIAGVTTTWNTGPGALEFGSRVEHDRPVDRAGTSQTYADVRARYLYSLAKLHPGLAKALRDGDVSGALTLGWFAYNRTYFARPGNTGLALFRYGLHGELSLFSDLLSFGLDATMFTDRRAANAVRPSELDLTPEIILHRHDWELHVAFETDRPIDRGGLTQNFLYAVVIWNFSLHRPTGPLENRGVILSP
jgi:hypothetical protein